MKQKNKKVTRWKKIVKAGYEQLSLMLFAMVFAVAFGLVSVVTNFKFGEDGMYAVMAGFAETALGTVLFVRIWDYMKENDYL